jgi:hypothetical protein
MAKDAAWVAAETRAGIGNDYIVLGMPDTTEANLPVPKIPFYMVRVPSP